MRKRITPFPLPRHTLGKGVINLKGKFLLSMAFAAGWFSLSLWFAVGWAREASYFLPAPYVWWVIAGIALLPGFLMSGMFFSNLLNRTLKSYPRTDRDTTVILCAYNEETTVARAIRGVLDQEYRGRIRLLVVDNASTDRTRTEIFRMMDSARPGRTLEYLYCGEQGKAHALNMGLARVNTPYFLTVDADTWLEKDAVQRMMDHLEGEQCGCAAGNLLAASPARTLAAKMQIYDYLLSIAAVKRFQGSYRSTLVAQGALSGYNTRAVRRAGGWEPVMGEDIVLTYKLLEMGLSSTYEPRAVGYTAVPDTMERLYNQRKRWAIGMLEGLSRVPPWRQRRVYTRHFTWVNISVIYLDLAYLLGFIPGVFLACMGYFYLVGFLTLFTLVVGAALLSTVYLYQRRLGVAVENSLWGFLAFVFLFQAIQSSAAVHGYLIHLFRRKEEWR